MPQLPRQANTEALSDREIVLECAERLRLSVEAESENRSKAIEALEFGDGKQWPDDLYNQRRIAKRPSLTINHTNTFVRRVVNNMRQQRPRIKVHAVGDGAKADIADSSAACVGISRPARTLLLPMTPEASLRSGWVGAIGGCIVNGSMKVHSIKNCALPLSAIPSRSTLTQVR